MQNAEKGQGQNLNGAELKIGIVQGTLQRKHYQHPVCLLPRRAAGTGCEEREHRPCHRARRTRSARGAAGTGRDTDQYDALVALGCIIRGETYHFELVANESGAGVTRLSLDYRLPIANAIITTENMEQAIARQVDKGRDAARVAVEMANLLNSYDDHE
jgi:6,7-dimethyl-8-ribityllumazine synthase